MEMLRLFYVIPLSLEKFKIEDFSFFFFFKSELKRRLENIAIIF